MTNNPSENEHTTKKPRRKKNFMGSLHEKNEILNKIDQKYEDPRPIGNTVSRRIAELIMKYRKCETSNTNAIKKIQ